MKKNEKTIREEQRDRKGEDEYDFGKCREGERARGRMRRLERASTWQSRVALRATSHPRGPARLIPSFCIFFIIIKHLKDENKSNSIHKISIKIL